LKLSNCKIIRQYVKFRVITMMKKIKFSEIKTKVPAEPGIYEIYTKDKTRLKVGIGINLRHRLLQHASSKQRCLKLKPGGNIEDPKDIRSKQSILAKHLYYDKSIAKDFDLTTEQGRQQFLCERCFIIFETMKSKDDAHKKEQLYESERKYRYYGPVIRR